MLTVLSPAVDISKFALNRWLVEYPTLFTDAEIFQFCALSRLGASPENATCPVNNSIDKSIFSDAGWPVETNPVVQR
ncbi:TPA: hypothetical protein NF036_002379 [Escherichia coli]|nr:hypothetical protein [Escherichia coli]